MKHRIFFLFAAFFAALFLPLAGCNGGPRGSGYQAQDGPSEVQFFAMDTLIVLTAYGKQGQAAVDAAREEITRLEALFSRTRTDSAVSALNGTAGTDTPAVLDSEAMALLALAQSVSEAVDGAFDVTVAPVMDAWGWTGEERQVPDPAVLADLLLLVDFHALKLDEANSSALLTRPGMSADLGGIAKGYAAGQAEAVVREAGITSAKLDLGGNITVIGLNAEGIPWRVAVRDPVDLDGYLCVLSLSDCTVATSGGYERYFEEDGVTYHHIIDPATGYPADSGLLSASVVSENAALADALSTSCFVLGTEKALELWRDGGDLDPFELVLCQEDGTVIVTEGLEEGFRPMTDSWTYEIARR